MDKLLFYWGTCPPGNAPTEDVLRAGIEVPGGADSRSSSGVTGLDPELQNHGEAHRAWKWLPWAIGILAWRSEITPQAR
jgi:hypothetical protein